MHRGFRGRSSRGRFPRAVAGNPFVSCRLPDATVRRNEATRTRTNQGLPLDFGRLDRARVALAVLSLQQPSLGLHLGYENGQVVVVSVDYGSMAQVSGLRPGQVVVMMDDKLLLAASESVKRAAAQSGEPTMVVMTAARDELICDGSGTCTLSPPYEFSSGISDGVPYYSWGGPPESWHELQSYPYGSMPMQTGLAILILGWLALSRGWAGPTLKPFALSLPVVTAVPLFVVIIDTDRLGVQSRTELATRALREGWLEVP